MGSVVKKLLKHILNYGLTTVIISIGSFFLIPIYTRYLTPANYALVDLIMTINTLLGMILVLGLNAAFSTFYYNSKNEVEINEYYSNIFNFLLIFVSLIISALIYINVKFGFSFVKNIPENYLNICFLTSGFSIFIQFPMCMMQFQEKSKKYGIVSVLQFLINTFLNILFVVFLNMQVKGILLAQFITVIMFFLLALILSKGMYFFKMDFYKIKKLLIVGLPIVPHAISGWCLTFIDRIILNNYVGLNDLGIYSFAYKIGSILFVIVSAINQAWTPMFMKISNKGPTCANKIFKNINRYYVFIVGSVVLILSFFVKEIAFIMAPKEYYLGFYIMPFIFLSYFFNGLYFMIVNSFFYTKKTYYLPIVTGISAFINISLNIMLIPRFGIYMAAFVNLITYIILFVCVYFLNLKVFKIQMPLKLIFIYSILNIISMVFIFNIEVNFISIIFKILLLVLIISLYYFLCINKEERFKIKEFCFKIKNQFIQ